LFFFCQVAAEAAGETTLADSRRILRRSIPAWLPSSAAAASATSATSRRSRQRLRLARRVRDGDAAEAEARARASVPKSSGGEAA
jgi:hypothetical protein